MATIYQHHEMTADTRRRVVQELLAQPAGSPQWRREAVIGRAVQTLEQEAPNVVATARAAGVEIEYVGTSPLFSETRLYSGDADTGGDWVLALARSPDDAVVPARERKALRGLKSNDISFPLIYVAHEVGKDKTSHLAPRDGGHAVLERSVGSQLVGPTPEPHESVILADQLAQRSRQLVNTAARVGRAVGFAAAGAAMAPVALLGGALASLATVDPIILGAIPAISASAGEPAAWFVLVRWDW